MHVCMYVCMYMHACTYVFMSGCIHLYLLLAPCARSVCLCVYVSYPKGFYDADLGEGEQHILLGAWNFVASFIGAVTILIIGVTSVTV